MRQVMQDMAKGATRIVEAPTPEVRPGCLLIRTHRTLISAGTERMLVDFGRASLLSKALKQPDRVRQVIDKMRTDGVLTATNAVRSKLSQPLPLGYCNVGTVIAVGEGVAGFSIGDRVASSGSHADVVCVPKNLCARIPDGVSDDEAAFTVIAAIGLQGIRLAAPTLGESFAVIGAGLIGLLVVQFLIANGCRVLAIDFDEERLALARSFGASTCNPASGADPVSEGMVFSRGRGMDGVIIAAATDSNDPVAQAARMSRKRGRIVLAGVTGLKLDRADFYEKELSFQVSCSYGPGRYDAGYEEQGHDYPVGFVRWTEQRNFEAVLDAMARGTVRTTPLITHRYAFDKAEEAYDTLTGDAAVLGILLDFPDRTEAELLKRELALPTAATATTGPASIAVVGAGNYASRVLIPAFRKTDIRFKSIVTANGLSAALQGEALGFAKASTDIGTVLGDPDVTAVAIATRHDSHADLSCRALAAGKHVFVEKPLALTLDQVDAVEQALQDAPGRMLMVGFNRRFSPHVVKARELLAGLSSPKSILMTVNAGAIPASHWTQDPTVGGGRIIGEGCHFIDLARHLAGAPIVASHAIAITPNTGEEITEDKASIQLRFADGSFATILYLANGSPAFPKERIEVFADGRVIQIDNFRIMRTFGWPGAKTFRLWQQDKGQNAAVAAFVDAISGRGPVPIPAAEIFEVARTSIAVAHSLRA